MIAQPPALTVVRHHRARALHLLGAFLALLLAASLPTFAAETQGVHCSVVSDQDGDEVVLMESQWISMHLLPRMQAIINRFVFRPTGNDIEEALIPKVRLANGGGILMDCFWEQDWRFQELKEKPYRFKITKNGPDEAQVIFETDVTGWVGSDNSGVISDLLSNMTLRRTVTLKAGEPFFRFDFEFLATDGKAKRPTFWAHNGSVITTTGTEVVLRPSARGIVPISGPYGTPGEGKDYVYDFNEGWTARISPQRNEGIIYLFDYDDVKMLYNSGNSTDEWTYDGILSTPKAPWHGRIYILPIIGLSAVDYANEYFICQLKPKREEGLLKLEYNVTSSYEKASRVTFNTEVEHGLLQDQKQTARFAPAAIDGLAFQPSRATTQVELTSPDPLVFNITAFVELPDGSIKKFAFQHYHAGDYDSGQGLNTRRDGKPLRLLDRPVHKPAAPPPPKDIRLNRDSFQVFGLLGLGSTRMGIPAALEQASPPIKLDVGYCTGQDAYGYALTDFPFDYERLFNYRVLLIANSRYTELRSIGASVLLPWLAQGGALVISGGEFAFTDELPEHEINNYLPIAPKPGNMVQGPQQLQKPEVPDHPIFRGIDLSDLPWQLYCHDIAVKENREARVLMRIGTYPFLVEARRDQQITMVVANNHFGTPEELGHTDLRHWSQWPKLYANIVRYAGGELK